ncbi:MAG: Stp1/IreP family PP2C-type Ser/Thr phosphatase [Culicoidibacterales bacterium]
METFYATNLGRIRQNNEDQVGIWETPTALVLAVADGMGGHHAGEVASQIAMETVEMGVKQLPQVFNKTAAKQWVVAILEHANQQIYEAAKADSSKKGMGTTLIIAIFHQDFLLVANLGDSRAYLVYENQITQLTEDQTFVNQLVKMGQISQEEASTHPQRNVLLQALGTELKIEVDLYDVDYTNVTGLLLCSDGLTDMVSDFEILAIFQHFKTAKATGEELIQFANEKGGKDNISVALVQTGGNVHAE